MPETNSLVTHISTREPFIIIERRGNEFHNSPHHHREFELSFIQNGRGSKRIVGDSIEEIGDFDLVLIGSESLDHVWELSEHTSAEFRGITIQFSPEVFGTGPIDGNYFSGIRTMLENARQGLKFPIQAIMKVYSILDNLPQQKDRFYQCMAVVTLLHELTFFKAEPLSGEPVQKSSGKKENKRIAKIKEYVNEHYAEHLGLNMLAGMVGMSPSSFSRYFRMQTGDTISNYISVIRLKAAGKALVDTNRTITDICYSCGFNNLSNFNRTFKAKHGISPREFRTMHRKK